MRRMRIIFEECSNVKHRTSEASRRFKESKTKDEKKARNITARSKKRRIFTWTEDKSTNLKSLSI